MTQLAERVHPMADVEMTPVPNSVLGKAFSILSCFDNQHDTLRLIDLSQRSGVPKPSVYRLAQELVELGLLARVGTSYRLGFAVFALGQRVDGASLLRRAARPVIVDLCTATRATVHLAVLDNDMTYYLEKLGGTRSVHSLSEVGTRLPATCTASGKLLIALDDHSDDLIARITGASLHRLTAYSAAESAALHREVAQIRRLRLATEREEVLLGFKSFALPIPDAAGNMIAALSATVPVAQQHDNDLIAHLRAAAVAIGRQHTRLSMRAQQGGRSLARVQ